MAIRHAAMRPKIQATWEANYKVYGIHKIWKQLARQGEGIGRDQVARLMKDLGIEGIRRGKKRRTTVADPSASRAPDLVDRNFTASRPNQLWVADFERHEALLNREEVQDLLHRAVAATR
jgi:putative transposase